MLVTVLVISRVLQSVLLTSMINNKRVDGLEIYGDSIKSRASGDVAIRCKCDNQIDIIIIN